MQMKTIQAQVSFLHADLEFLAGAYREALASADAETTPIYTRHGSWQMGRSWSSGYCLGVLVLLARLLDEKDLLKVVYTHLRKLDGFLKEERFQDVGFLWRSSFCPLFEMTGDEELLNSVIQASEYLMSLTNSRGWMFVSWKGQGEYVGVDQFMNLDLLLWAYERTRIERYADVALGVARFGVAQLVRDDGATLEYVRQDPDTEEFLPVWANCEVPDAVWSRGHAWAIRGTLKAGVVADDTALISTGIGLMDFIVQRYQVAGKLPAIVDRPGFALEDTSAAAAIYDIADWCILSGKLSRDHLLQLSKHRDFLGKMLFQDNNIRHRGKGLLRNASMPLRLIDTAGEFSAWGDFFILSVLERNNG